MIQDRIVHIDDCVVPLLSIQMCIYIMTTVDLALVCSVCSFHDRFESSISEQVDSIDSTQQMGNEKNGAALSVVIDDIHDYMHICHFQQKNHLVK